MLFSLLHDWLIPSALADVSQLGASDPAVRDMWSILKSTFPHTDWGCHAPFYLMMNYVAPFVLSLIGGTAICSIVYAGIKIITAGGDDGKISEAKTIIMYSLIGVVLAILADSIMLYFSSVIIPMIFGGVGTGGPC